MSAADSSQRIACQLVLWPSAGCPLTITNIWLLAHYNQMSADYNYPLIVSWHSSSADSNQQLIISWLIVSRLSADSSISWQSAKRNKISKLGIYLKKIKIKIHTLHILYIMLKTKNKSAGPSDQYLFYLCKKPCLCI